MCLVRNAIKKYFAKWIHTDETVFFLQFLKIYNLTVK